MEEGQGTSRRKEEGRTECLPEGGEGGSLSVLLVINIQSQFPTFLESEPDLAIQCWVPGSYHWPVLPRYRGKYLTPPARTVTHIPRLKNPACPVGLRTPSALLACPHRGEYPSRSES